MNAGLEQREWATIADACSQFPEIEQVVLYGSRARGNFRRGSDIDLALKGPAVNPDTVMGLHDELNEETLLPYFFDVVNYGTITNPEFAAEIDRVGLVIYEKPKTDDWLVDDLCLK